MAKDDYKERQLNAWTGENMKQQLSNDEIVALIEEYKKYGDVDVRNKIVEHNARLIAFIVYRYGQKCVNSITDTYPSYEDLMQEGVLVCIRAIERFDLNYNFTFSTYLSKALTHKFNTIKNYSKRNKRDGGKIVSLDAQMKNKSKFSEGGENTYLDFVADKKSDMKTIDDRLDLEFCIHQILPILPQEDRNIFYDHHFNNMAFIELGEKYGVSRERIRQKIEAISQEVKRMYEEGISADDLLFKGANYQIGTQKSILARNGIVKKYGRDFLVNCFVPKLTRLQKRLFEEAFLHEYGQTTVDIAKSLGIAENAISIKIKRLLIKIKQISPKDVEDYYKGKNVHMNKNQFQSQQEINRTERFVDERGGKYFLGKYFMPVLSEMEKKYFNLRYLNYDGALEKEIQTILGISSLECEDIKKSCLEKLDSIDFEEVVSLIDKAGDNNIVINELSPMSLRRNKERRKLVEEKGGILKLRKYFLPILTESEAKVFEDLYLDPKYESAESFAKQNNLNHAKVVQTEKILVNKLNSTDIDELEKINKAAGGLGRKYIGKTSNWAGKFGEEFIREYLMPKIKVKAHRIIFEKTILDKCSVKDILEELNLSSNREDYVKKIKKQIFKSLRDFEAKDNSQEIIKDFYAKKEFEKAHPEDFEKSAFVDNVAFAEEKKLKENELEKIGKNSLILKRKEFMKSYLERFGGASELRKRFLPSLRSIMEQYVFLNSFLQYKLDEEVQNEFGLTSMELTDLKNAIVLSLEKYKERKEYKEKNK